MGEDGAKSKEQCHSCAHSNIETNDCYLGEDPGNCKKFHSYKWLEEDMRTEPPCQECGAMTEEEAEEKCICSGDKDNCHGCELWPEESSLLNGNGCL
jgi:hypothetical protein